MFEATKYSVYIGEGKEEVKNAASYISKPVGERGVKLALDYFNVI